MVAEARPGLNVYADSRELALAGAELFRRLAAEAVAVNGRFSVALSGGSTPRALYELLAREPFRWRVEWPLLEVFWSDERAVPPDDPQSNFGMAREALLRYVPLLPDAVHRMPAERTPLDAAADEYAAEIRRTLGADSAEAPRFDLIMLGMGDDGHTASLFPESPALDERERIVAPNFVAKLGVHRLTFTPKLINAATSVLFLVAGADKARALAAVLEGPHAPRRYPAQLVAPEPGALYWVMDAAAASGLGRGQVHGAHPLS